MEHSLYILLKGFSSAAELEEARRLFGIVAHTPLLLDDDSLDIGAYIDWARRIPEDIICPLNTASELLAEKWLHKLFVNLMLPNVGLVGATCSYESLNDWNPAFPAFPNPHIRSNSFMMRRRLFCDITAALTIHDKLDAFGFESGQQNLTRRVRAMGQEVLVVGRNGRGYSTRYWPRSDTFRLGIQDNLLVGDNQTRNYMALRWPEKHEFVLRSWGHYIREAELLE